MLLGVVRKNKRKLCLGVNKQGFASIYALLILQIVMAFVMLLLSSSKSILANKQMKDDLHTLQLYAIYHIKAHLHEPAQHSGDEFEEIQEDTTTEGNKHEEVMTYHNQEITIQYDTLRVDIYIAHVHMSMELDNETKNIKTLVYL